MDIASIKEHVEEICSLEDRADVAGDKGDMFACHSLDVQKLRMEQLLSRQNILILKDKEDDILHVYIDGKKCLSFNPLEWIWIPVEGAKNDV